MYPDLPTPPHPDARQPGASGVRQTTACALQAAHLADLFNGLPEGITRWRLAAALRSAARALDLSNTELRLLQLYIDLTYDIDWTAGSEPIVYRPLVEIAEHMGRSERQIRNLEHSLVRKGLLAWRDSGNHHRKGRRDRHSHRLIYAYGISLAPLGTRCDDLIALADRARREIHEQRRCRIAISALRRQIRSCIAAMNPDAPETTELIAQFAMVPDRHPAATPHATLQRHHAALKAMAETAFSSLQQTPEANALPKRVSTKPETERRTYTDTTTKNSINGVRHSHEPASQASNKHPPHTERNIAPTITPHRLRAAVSDNFQTILDATTRCDWQAFVEAAQHYALMQGIDPKSWGAACELMGRKDAALCITVIDHGLHRNADDKYRKIEKPNAYFHAILRRYSENRLNLSRSIHAIVAKSLTRNSFNHGNALRYVG